MDHVLHGPDGGHTIPLGPNQVVIRLAGDDTDGALSLCDYLMAAGGPEPPPHLHERTDEAFHVLEGELRVRVGERDRHLSPGATLWVRRGTLHTMANAGSEAVRVLLIYAPAGFEGYFAEMGAFRRTLPPGPPDRAKIQSKALELSERYDQVVLSLQESG